MTSLLHGVDRLFDLAFRLMKPLPALGVLALFAILTAVFSLLVVRWTSNQKAIRRMKDLIGAHVLEVRLFSDQPRVVLRAYLSLLVSLFGYLAYAMVPLLVLGLPLLLIYGQLEDRFAHMPVRPGCDFLLSANFANEDSLADVVLRLPPELVQTAPPVQIGAEREIEWRIQGKRSGIFDLDLVLHGQELSKRVVIGPESARIVPGRIAGSFWQQFMSPGEPPLPRGGLVEQIRIQYPLRLFGVGPWKVGWLVPYAALTVIAVVLLRTPLRTEI